MVRHRFTPAEANRTLPLVKRIVADILERGRALRELAPDHGGRGDREIRVRISALEGELLELAGELERIGCSYKDWGYEAGLVDFPSEIGGRPVLLCWRSDEERVGWYHTPEAGFAGRTRIPAHLLEDVERAR
jgi:hypothetical protein